MRCINKEKFQEELLFCQSLQTTFCGVDIYNKLNNYFDNHKIPKSNIVLCAADCSPSMMDQNLGCLKLINDDNPSMLVVHCVIQRENLVAKNVSPKLHEILYCVIKCFNSLKANSKAECLFQRFCEVNHANYVNCCSTSK